MKYNYNGKVVEVCSGLTGAEWFSAIRKPSGAVKRVKSKYLPVRAHRAEAEADLLAWATDKNLSVMVESAR